MLLKAFCRNLFSQNSHGLFYDCIMYIIILVFQACVWVVPGYLIGGEKKKAEKARLRKGINILVATSGRLIDHIHHTKSLSLAKVKYLVIDEADRLLDMGYERSVTRWDLFIIFY